MQGLTRRNFVKTAAVSAGALAISPTAKVLGANDQVNTGSRQLPAQLTDIHRRINPCTVRVGRDASVRQ